MKIVGDFVMAEKNNLKYIKTASDLNHLYDFDKEALFKDDTYVLAPDFDLDIFINAPTYESTDPGARRFYQKLMDNTLKSLNKKQKDEFANRLADSLKNYWDLVYRFGGAEKWNGEELQKRAEYTPFAVLFEHASRRDLFSDEAFAFKKSISPDNQVLLNKSGFMKWGGYNYNFSNQRFEDVKLIMPFIPRQNWGLCGDDKLLAEKFEKDFGRAFNPKDAFKDAKHPDVLFELRSGKIHPTLAMPKLDSSDLKYIIPKHDFMDLDSGQIYDLLSLRNVRWDQWQVASMMEMIVDKVPDVDNTAYLNQIMEIITVNNQLFLKNTENNHKLWLKIEDKFKDAAQKNKEYKETLKVSIEKLRADIEKENASLDNLIRKRNYLEYSEKRKNETLQAKMENIRDFGGDYYKNNSEVIKKALDNVLNGKFEKLADPEKPWKLFGFDKEKKQYEELLGLIKSVNMYIEFVKDMRDKEFGQHEFNSWSMQSKLQNDISKKQQKINSDEYDIQYNESIISARKPIESVKEKADMQKDAKKARMENYQKKLKEKGVVLGQKSGVVKADEKARAILYNKAVRGIMKKLRTTHANANKSEEELMTIAKKVLAENQK